MAATENNPCENCGKSEALYTVPAKDFTQNVAGVQKGEIDVCERCLRCFEGRNKCTKAILNSDSFRRLIVAGPGTGKTTTFKKVIASLSDESEILAFTLINNLAEDLKSDLASLQRENLRVSTFHGFCREMLHSRAELDGLTNHFEYFPLLPVLISQDAEFVGAKYTLKDFNHDFANINDDGGALRYYLDRSSYYNAVSHEDAVYRVLKSFQENSQTIPEFDLIIADEYQDFNALEASFIDLLGNDTSLLIAGDDDQALYAFRHASKEFIRELFNGKDFDKFALPYCSRCSPVLVRATNHFVDAALKARLLRGRIPREYQAYWPDKHREDAKYPVIDWANCTTFKTALEYLRSKIVALTENEGLNGREKTLQFLVIGPESGYHLKQVAEYLKERLSPDQFEVLTSPDKPTLQITEGYRILEKRHNLNLGWRIVLHCDPIPETKDIITESVKKGRSLESLMPDVFIKKHRAEMKRIAAELAAKKNDDIEVELEETQDGKIRIKLTNFYGCKGLSALHSIVVGMNDGSFPADPKHLTDDEICKFIVALTRARRSCTLVSNKEYNKNLNRSVDRPSTFIRMLPEDALQKQKCSMLNKKLRIQ